MILALDSSASRGSVALLDGDDVVREISIEAPRGRGGALFGALEEVLRGKPKLDRVVAGIGPGSYNGIRAALAGGWGVAQARGIPVIGVCSLLGLDDGTYCAVGDARRGQYYFAEVRDGTIEQEPFLLDPAEIPARIAGRRVFVPASVEFLPEAEIRYPSAAKIGRIGARMDIPHGVPEPLYLKAPYITEPKTVG